MIILLGADGAIAEGEEGVGVTFVIVLAGGEKSNNAAVTREEPAEEDPRPPPPPPDGVVVLGATYVLIVAVDVANVETFPVLSIAKIL